MCFRLTVGNYVTCVTVTAVESRVFAFGQLESPVD